MLCLTLHCCHRVLNYNPPSLQHFFLGRGIILHKQLKKKKSLVIFPYCNSLKPHSALKASPDWGLIYLLGALIPLC